MLAAAAPHYAAVDGQNQRKRGVCSLELSKLFGTLKVKK